MPNDPGLANDTCIFVEAISGDGGVHNPNDTWWLSPDISLVGPISGPDKADPGQVNPIQLKSTASQAIAISRETKASPSNSGLLIHRW